jgi:hypothetical protein
VLRVLSPDPQGATFLLAPYGLCKTEIGTPLESRLGGRFEEIQCVVLVWRAMFLQRFQVCAAVPQPHRSGFQMRRAVKS